MFFAKISKPDIEVLNLFTPYRKIFKGNKKSSIKQLSKLINKCVEFFKVFDGGFEGCLFIYEIDHDKKIVEFGGFAKRKANTKQAIKELLAYINHHYKNYLIISDTKELSAKMCLRGLGFRKNNKGEYYYG